MFCAMIFETPAAARKRSTHTYVAAIGAVSNRRSAKRLRASFSQANLRRRAPGRGLWDPGENDIAQCGSQPPGGPVAVMQPVRVAGIDHPVVGYLFDVMPALHQF